jgi:type II secretory pathway component GspD/PulD (secretin)
MKRKWFVWAAALQLITLMQVTTPAQTLIDLEFNRARVQDVLQVLRRLGDFNIVADPQVTGEVTVFLKQVTVREAVGLVAQAAGYSYRFQGNTVHIATEQRMGALFAPSAQSGLQNVEVIYLNHADPEGLANVLRATEPNATVTVDAFTRSLVVSGSDRAIASVRRLIPLLDTIQRQVLVEARLVEVSVESLNRLGLTWDLPSFALSLKRGVSLSMTSEELGIALEALSTEGSARILANPKISAVNATTATFFDRRPDPDPDAAGRRPGARDGISRVHRSGDQPGDHAYHWGRRLCHDETHNRRERHYGDDSAKHPSDANPRGYRNGACAGRTTARDRRADSRGGSCDGQRDPDPNGVSLGRQAVYA